MQIIIEQLDFGAIFDSLDFQERNLLDDLFNHKGSKLVQVTLLGDVLVATLLFTKPQ